MSGSGGIIPKFSSFKPKETNETGAHISGAGASSEGYKGHQNHRRHRSRSRDRNRNSEKHKSVERESKSAHSAIRRDNYRGLGQKKEEDGNWRTLPKADVLTTRTQQPSSFFADRKGDPQILTYGRLHRYDVPAFHRSGAGRVLGAARHLRIDRESSADDNSLILCSRIDEVTHREKYAFSRVERRMPKLLRILPEIKDKDDEPTRTADFIALSRKRVRRTSSSGEESNGNKKHYRSIEGKAKPVAETNTEYITDSDSETEPHKRRLTYSEMLKQKTITLSRAVEADPQSVDAWLELINHQDSVLGLENIGRKKETSAERQSTADIKIHLYEKALEKNKTNITNREILLKGLMEEGAKFWDFKTKADKWRKVSEENLDSLVLWKEYLNFQQTNFSTFRYEQIRDLYLSRVRLLRTALTQTQHLVIQSSGTETGTTKLNTLLEHLIYTVLRATVFMREAGFVELAIGVWQGILELNFHQPEIASSQRMRHLQEFWDSEVPRVGEAKAAGWKAYFVDNNASQAPDPQTDEALSAADFAEHELFGPWTVAENQKSSTSRYPARTMDDVAEDDPYRVILWSDIEEYIVDLGDDQDRMATLIDAFLIFCRLPPQSPNIHRPSTASMGWWKESFLRGEDLEPTLHIAQDDQEFSIEGLIASEKARSERQRPSQSCFIPFADTLFPLEGLPHYLPTLKSASDDNDREQVPYDWIQNVLKSLTTVPDDSGMAEYWLAFEFSNKSSTVKKITKGLLKREPENLCLYNAYALVEASKENTDLAVNIISAALSIKVQVTSPAASSSIMLWKSWTWILLEAGDPTAAYKIILTIPAGVTEANTIDHLSPSSLLKCRQHLHSERSWLQSSSKSYLAVQYTECMALLEYLANDGKERNIEAALAVFNSFSITLSSSPTDSSSANELLHQSAARLLQHHMKNSNSYRPDTVRTFLTNSLGQFPRNTILLSIYAQNERRLRIDDRVRKLLNTTILTPRNDTLTSRLFAINHESTTGNVHSQHASYENALASPACASSPGLWRMYISFCVSSAEYSGKAKDVFYRAIRACPWSKRLFMLAFEELRGLLSFDELRHVYLVMAEKGLRIHVGLEERFDLLDEEAGRPRMRIG